MSVEKRMLSLDDTSSTDVWYFIEEPGDRLTPGARAFFADYSGIEGDPLLKHLKLVRQRAWAVRSYPCVGLWTFLEPKIGKVHVQNDILRRVKSGQSIMDVGCFLGQDLRWLAAQGAPTERMYGVDVEEPWWEISFELFNDRDKFHGHFLQADLLSTDSALTTVREQIDVIWTASMLHEFSWEKQLHILKELIKTTRPGSLIAGIVAGRVGGKEVQTNWKGRQSFFHHDTDTMKRLWLQAANESETEWEVRAEMFEASLISRDIGSEFKAITFEAVCK